MIIVKTIAIVSLFLVGVEDGVEENECEIVGCNR